MNTIAYYLLSVLLRSWVNRLNEVLLKVENQEVASTLTGLVGEIEGVTRHMGETD